jgi:hypothetical protein
MLRRNKTGIFLLKLYTLGSIMEDRLMPLVSLDQTTADLADHLEALRGLIASAWKRFHELVLPEAQVEMTPRSRASAVHDLIIGAAKRYAASREDVRFFERQDMKGLVFLERYAIRFKKLDESAHSRSRLTKQVLDFRAQLELDGIDAVHHLEAGYVLNKEQTAIHQIMLACPAGRANHWVTLLKEESAQMPIVPLVQQDLLEDEEPIIKPKTDALKKRTRRSGS